MTAEADPRPAKARAMLQDLLVGEAALFAPLAEDGSDLPSPLPTEWLLMSAWVDEDGESWITGIASEALLKSHRVGLLHMALYDMDEEWEGRP